MSDVGDRVRGVMGAVLGRPPAELTDDASPDTLTSWDSLRHVQLILALEEAFHMQFSVDQMDALQTVGGVIRAISIETGGE